MSRNVFVAAIILGLLVPDMYARCIYRLESVRVNELKIIGVVRSKAKGARAVIVPTDELVNRIHAENLHPRGDTCLLDLPTTLGVGDKLIGATVESVTRSEVVFLSDDTDPAQRTRIYVPLKTRSNKSAHAPN
jgi:hypothetical protein